MRLSKELRGRLKKDYVEKHRFKLSRVEAVEALKELYETYFEIKKEGIEYSLLCRYKSKLSIRLEARYAILYTKGKKASAQILQSALYGNNPFLTLLKEGVANK